MSTSALVEWTRRCSAGWRIGISGFDAPTRAIGAEQFQKFWTGTGDALLITIDGKIGTERSARLCSRKSCGNGTPRVHPDVFHDRKPRIHCLTPNFLKPLCSRTGFVEKEANIGFCCWSPTL